MCFSLWHPRRIRLRPCPDDTRGAPLPAGSGTGFFFIACLLLLLTGQAVAASFPRLQAGQVYSAVCKNDDLSYTARLRLLDRHFFELSETIMMRGERVTGAGCRYGREACCCCITIMACRAC